MCVNFVIYNKFHENLIQNYAKYLKLQSYTQNSLSYFVDVKRQCTHTHPHPCTTYNVCSEHKYTI